jgi:plasmid stabilization system protein ParE
MVKHFHLLPEAEQDAAEAYGWYEERQLGLGEEFLRCVEACVQSIRRNPETYSYAEDTVTIYAIFHCSQDPRKWRARLP